MATTKIITQKTTKTVEVEEEVKALILNERERKVLKSLLVYDVTIPDAVDDRSRHEWSSRRELVDIMQAIRVAL